MGRSMTARSAPRNAASKVAQQRLSVLELGNVAEACRRRGMDRTGAHDQLEWMPIIPWNPCPRSRGTRRTGFRDRDHVGLLAAPRPEPASHWSMFAALWVCS